MPVYNVWSIYGDNTQAEEHVADAPMLAARAFMAGQSHDVFVLEVGRPLREAQEFIGCWSYDITNVTHEKTPDFVEVMTKTDRERAEKQKEQKT